MKAYTMHKAKTQLSQLVAEAEAGEDVVIMRGKKAAVRLVVVAEPTSKRIPGRLKGLIKMTDAFFDPLPEEELRLWNGEGEDF